MSQKGMSFLKAYLTSTYLLSYSYSWKIDSRLFEINRESPDDLSSVIIFFKVIGHLLICLYLLV